MCCFLRLYACISHFRILNLVWISEYCLGNNLWSMDVLYNILCVYKWNAKYKAEMKMLCQTTIITNAQNAKASPEPFMAAWVYVGLLVRLNLLLFSQVSIGKEQKFKPHCLRKYFFLKNRTLFSMILHIYDICAVRQSPKQFFFN